MTTIRITDEEFALATRTAPKLSRVPPGHWRCVFKYVSLDVIDEAKAIAYGVEILAPGVLRFPDRFVSRDVAETTAAAWVADANRQWRCHIVDYLRADYFPGERP